MVWSWSNFDNWSNWYNLNASFGANNATVTDGEAWDPTTSSSVNYYGSYYFNSFVVSVNGATAGDELFLDFSGTTFTAVGNNIYSGATLIATVSGGSDGTPLTITPATLSTAQQSQGEVLGQLVSAVRYVNDDSSEAYTRTIQIASNSTNGTFYSSATVTSVEGASQPLVSLSGIENGVGDATAATTVPNGSSYDQNPTVAALEGGGYVATWMTYNTATGNYDIAVQRLDADGQSVGSIVTLDAFTNYYDYNPSVATLDGGGFVVSWHGGNDGSGTGIYAQQFDASGAASGAIFLVNSTTSNNQQESYVAALSDGGFMISWSTIGTNGTWEIHAQRYDSSGIAVGGEFEVNTATANTQQSPSVAVLADGSIVAAFFSNASGTGEVRFQHLDSGGSPLGSEVSAITGLNSFSTHPAITSLEGGGFVIVAMVPVGDGDEQGVVAHIYDADGNAVGDQFVANQITAGSQIYPSATALSDGGFVLTWQSLAGDNYYDIVAQRFSSDGKPIGDEFTVFSGTSSNGSVSSGYPAAVELADGSLAFVWSADNIDVQTKVFDLHPTGLALHGNENSDLSIPLTLEWPDQDGSETMQVVLTGFPDGATFNLGAAGSAGTWVIDVSDPADLATLVLTPPHGVSGDFNLQVTATSTESGNADTASDAMTIAVSLADAPNDDPVLSGAQATLAAGTEDVPYTVTLAELVQGYSDPDGDALNVANLASDHGTITDNGDGTFTLTPTGDYHGPVQFTYDVVDGNGGTAPATLGLSLDPANDLPTGAVTVSGTYSEDEVLTASNTLADADGMGTVTYQWQRNGVDIDGATGPTYTLGQADVGNVIRAVATYTDGDGTTENVTSPATPAIANVNDSPTGSVTISGTVEQDQVLTASNTLVDEDGLGVVHYQWQRDGSDVGGATDSTYTLGQDDVGHTITVVASYTDGNGTAEHVASDPTGAVANVNDSPVLATGGPIAATEQTEAAILSGASVSDADLDALNGGNGDYAGASLTISRNSASNAEDSFTLADGANFSVNGTNLETSGGQVFGQISTNADGVLVIDFTSSQSIATSALVDEVLQSIHYTDGSDTPPASVQLAVSFDDGSPGGGQGAGATGVDTNIVTVNIAPVNDPPSGTVTISGTAEEDQVLTASNTLDDSDGMGGVSYQWQRDGGDIGGATGSTYTLGQADVGHNITVVASYTDGQGTAEQVASDPTAAVANVNDLPTTDPAAESASGNEDTVITGTLLAGSDEDGDALTYEMVSAANGSVIINPTTGAFSFTPDANYNGTTSFSYVVKDASGSSAPKSVSVEVLPVNDAPTVSAAVTSSANDGDAAYSVNLLAGASDVDGDSLSVSGLTLVDGDASGITVNGNSLEVDPSAYVSLAAGESAVIQYSYLVDDGHSGTVAQTATITINGGANAPVAVNDAINVEEDHMVSGSVLTGAGADSDPDGDALHVIKVEASHGSTSISPAGSVNLTGDWGTLHLNSDGTYSYTADGYALDSVPTGQTRDDIFTYTVSDGHGGTDTATLTVTVTAIDNPPPPPPPPPPPSGTDTQNGTSRGDILNGDRHQVGAIDIINGNGGNDKIDGKAGNDQLHGGSGTDQIWGHAGDDRMYGDAGTDTLWGGDGNDGLDGGAANDKLYGEAGNDYLIGGKGNDMLSGGTGADTFGFLAQGARESDVITDFKIGEDILDLQSGVSITSESSVRGSTVLHLSSGATVTLTGVSLADWNAAESTSIHHSAHIDLI